MKIMKLERCGYCGSYFRGSDLLTAEDLKIVSQKEFDEVQLGYCPNAMQEHYELYPEQNNE